MNNGDVFLWKPEKEQGFSIGWNLQLLIDVGLPDKTPPTSSTELLEQIAELIQVSTNEWSNQTINSLDNYLVPFLAEEKPSKIQFIEQIEAFFTNLQESNTTITLDLIPREELTQVENHQVILDAVNDVIHQVYRAQMNHGAFKPNITINLHPETDWHSNPLNQWLELSYLYGLPTYQNLITGTISPETIRPRHYKPKEGVTYLRLGGVLGDAEAQAVSGYACINLAKIGETAVTEPRFFELLDERIETAVELLKEKHDKVTNSMKPFTEALNKELTWCYSVITLTGMNEALITLIDAPIGHVAGKAVTYKLLEHLLRRLEQLQKETGILLSLESYQSELPGARLLGEYESEHITLTPATELPSNHGDDLWDVFEHQKKYHSLYTGGTLMQIHLEQGLDYNDGLRLLVERLIENFGYNYIAISPVFSLCPEHGYVRGDNNCPHCQGETTAYIRVDNQLIKVSELPNTIKEAYWRRVYYDVKNK